MELSALTGRAPSPWLTLGVPLVADDDIALVGVRALDGVTRTSIRVWDCQQLRVGGVAAVARKAAACLAEVPTWLHFDVDTVDPNLMPVIYPAGAGLTFPETAALLRTMLGAKAIIGMDVTCFHPNLDRTGAATAALVRLLSDVLGSPQPA